VPTVFSPRYCCPAAATNSTEKQLAVVGAAKAEGLIDLRKVPFDEDEAWASHRVAIIDLDAHPGDGTYRLSRGREGIALFDIAGGSWVDVANSPSIEYHVVREAGEYSAALGHIEAFLDRVRPELVMFQAGMDPYEHDPVGGIPGVDEAFLRRRDAHVIARVSWRRIPLVVNLAGGYVDGVERLHLMTVRSMAMGLACATTSVVTYTGKPGSSTAPRPRPALVTLVD